KQNKVAPNVTVATVIASGYNTIDYGFVEGGGAPASNNEYYVSHFKDDGSVIYTDRWIAGAGPGKSPKREESNYNETTSPEPETSGDETAIKESESIAGGDTVYITNEGKKYHRAGCRYLSKSKIPISRGEAERQGYTPCSVCKP
ncbi:MAG: hypothetical protein JW984_14455, partial [Deltaproteobacteria bacterium]|nr:hypothetical protein [Candidatus Zymogenus saltonus]